MQLKQLIFRVKGCRVRVNFYFFALLCAAAYFDRSGKMLWGMFAAVLHELGHLTAMLLLLGHAPREISVTPFGIRIGSSPLAEFEKGNLMVLAAGSGVNFLSFAATFGFLPDFAWVSLLLGLFNMLPVENMDGGGILRIALEKIMSEDSAVRVMNIVSWLTLTAMLMLGIHVLFITGYNFTLIGAALLLALTRHKKSPFF